ncbi:hypothetical protein DPMN_058187 [Dreissena polymorpha]|uniref:Uncharacterized protein n=2 Tax=Dreissena polymorpha TaxID=45954 RepID=A0A9D4HFU1_DREPO|nr:hypothetical protein DPMN_058187 [Dreissena polymorpha]
MMREWIGLLPETLVLHSDPNLPPHVSTWCKNHDIYLLSREIDPETTTHGSAFATVL